MEDKSDASIPRQLVAERVTVGLIPKVATELQQIQSRTGLSKTDVVNRSISLYEFLEARINAGDDLLLKAVRQGRAWMVHREGVVDVDDHGEGSVGFAVDAGAVVVWAHCAAECSQARPVRLVDWC
jgi:hypothetical protein